MVYGCNPLLVQPAVRPYMPHITMISAEKSLAMSVVLESISTLFLTKTSDHKMWFFPVYLGYASSFYMFPKALQKYKLSFAYTIWSGFGIILTTIYDAIKLRKMCELKQIIGSVFVLVGIYLVAQCK